MRSWEKKQASTDMKQTLDLSEYNRKYTDPFCSKKNNGPNNIILTEKIKLAIDSNKTGRNLNVLVVGGAGSGKTSSFIEPNLMQANTSYVVTDPDGILYAKYGNFLEGDGYSVKCLNLKNTNLSCNYNPLLNLKTDADISVLVDALLQNTRDPNVRYYDDFMEKAIKILICAVLGYLVHDFDKASRTFSNMMKILRAAQPDVEGEKTLLDYAFEQYKEKHGEDVCVNQYAKFKAVANKDLLQDIVASALVRLQALERKNIIDLTTMDNLDIASLADEKTALFIIPAEEPSTNVLAPILLSQIFRVLTAYCKTTATYTQIVMDADKQVWKTFRAESMSDSEYVSRPLAEAWLDRAKKATVQFNMDMGWWEARTEHGELVGHRGTEHGMRNALSKLRGGKVFSNRERAQIGRLPIHLRFLLDEFANMYIPNLNKCLTHSSRLGISVNIILQSIQQIKAVYEHDWDEIVGNCDSILYFGCGANTTTLQWFAGLNSALTTETLLSMSRRDCILLFIGMPPYKGSKYLPFQHLNWKRVRGTYLEKGAYVFCTGKIDYLSDENKPRLAIFNEKTPS